MGKQQTETWSETDGEQTQNNSETTNCEMNGQKGNMCRSFPFQQNEQQFARDKKRKNCINYEKPSTEKSLEKRPY